MKHGFAVVETTFGCATPGAMLDKALIIGNGSGKPLPPLPAGAHPGWATLLLKACGMVSNPDLEIDRTVALVEGMDEPERQLLYELLHAKGHRVQQGSYTERFRKAREKAACG